MTHKKTLNITIPVYNEEVDLEKSITTLADYLRQYLVDFDWIIAIVDNASTDKTFAIAKRIAKTNAHIIAIHLDQKGRGRAVKYAWQKLKTDYSAYMDVDLSSDLRHFGSLVHSLTKGYDIAIGSRNAPGARVYGRNFLRTITSKTYILLIKCFFWVHFSDAQCGFKAVSRRIVDLVIPSIEDNAWFFDTELLIIAEKKGYRIYEEPVTWIDNPGSTVRVLNTAKGDLEGLRRLFFTRPWTR